MIKKVVFKDSSISTKEFGKNILNIRTTANISNSSFKVLYKLMSMSMKESHFEKNLLEF